MADIFRNLSGVRQATQENDCSDVHVRHRQLAAIRGIAASSVFAALSVLVSACAPLAVLTGHADDTLANPTVATSLMVASSDEGEGTSGKSGHKVSLAQIDEQGLASWYGARLHGRKTASGERFNQNELTAAHPTYAFGTLLCVRSKGNGKSVVVRVNDRGPWGKNRVIDLSKAAAKALGMLHHGVQQVEIYKLTPEDPKCPLGLD